MIFDRRMPYDEVIYLSSVYIMANSHHFVNSSGVAMAAYEKGIFDFLRRTAQQIVPFICIDRQLKLATRDIAINALNNFTAATKSKAYETARRQLTDGVNAIVKMTTGANLYMLMVESYEVSMKLIKNPIDELTEEEKILITSAGFTMENRAINAGLVKHQSK
jgi:hypothetical protein